MDENEITFEDLLAAEPPGLTPASSYEQLRAEGFPQHGGLAELAAIVQMTDRDTKFAALRSGYEEIFAVQREARSAGVQAAALGRAHAGKHSGTADVRAQESISARQLALR